MILSGNSPMVPCVATISVQEVDGQKIVLYFDVAFCFMFAGCPVHLEKMLEKVLEKVLKEVLEKVLKKVLGRLLEKVLESSG